MFWEINHGIFMIPGIFCKIRGYGGFMGQIRFSYQNEGSTVVVHSLGTSFIKKIKLDSRFENLEHKKISITWSL